MTSPCRLASLLVAIALTVTAPPQAFADEIDPGFDLFITPGDGSSIVDLTGLGLGVVPLVGDPLPGAPADADTIVARLDPGPPAGSSGTIDIELVALSLESVSPIDLTPLGGPFVGLNADLHILIDRSFNFFTDGFPFPDGTGTGPSLFNLPFNTLIPRSFGLMNILHPLNFHTGGSFDACFGNATQCAGLGAAGLGLAAGGIFADAFFTVVGGDPADLNDVLIHNQAPPIALASSGEWVHIPRNGRFVSGNFVVTNIMHTGPHPAQPIVPEPGAALLVGTGLLGLLAMVRRIPRR